jgi:hypothetical protein
MNHITYEDYMAVLRGEMPIGELEAKARRHLIEIDPRFLTRRDIEAAKKRLAWMRSVLRDARRDLRELKRLPWAQWRRRVAKARTRFRSRTLAHLLLDESRRCLPDDPVVAADLAALVPEVLAWTAERPDLLWAPPLIAEARRRLEANGRK